MKWSHLPEAGGLYDQNPDILERFMYMFQELGKEQEREQDKNKAEQQRASRKK